MIGRWLHLIFIFLALASLVQAVTDQGTGKEHVDAVLKDCKADCDTICKKDENIEACSTKCENLCQCEHECNKSHLWPCIFQKEGACKDLNSCYEECRKNNEGQ